MWPPVMTCLLVDPVGDLLVGEHTCGMRVCTNLLSVCGGVVAHARVMALGSTVFNRRRAPARLGGHVPRVERARGAG